MIPSHRKRRRSPESQSAARSVLRRIATSPVDNDLSTHLPQPRTDVSEALWQQSPDYMQDSWCDEVGWGPCDTVNSTDQPILEDTTMQDVEMSTGDQLERFAACNVSHYKPFSKEAKREVELKKRVVDAIIADDVQMLSFAADSEECDTHWLDNAVLCGGLRGMNAVNFAAARASTNVFNHLVFERGASINIPDYLSDYRPLILAVSRKCQRGHTVQNEMKIIDTILAHDSSSGIVDATGIFGRTALDAAVRREFVDAVLALLKAGANALHQDHDGRTPFSIACNMQDDRDAWPTEDGRGNLPRDLIYKALVSHLAERNELLCQCNKAVNTDRACHMHRHGNVLP